MTDTPMSPQPKGEDMAAILRAQAADRSRYLNPTHATPVGEGEAERIVRNLRRSRHAASARPGKPFNPNGAEAASLIETQAAENAELRAKIKALEEGLLAIDPGSVVLGNMVAAVALDDAANGTQHLSAVAKMATAIERSRTLTQGGQ